MLNFRKKGDLLAGEANNDLRLLQCGVVQDKKIESPVRGKTILKVYNKVFIH